MPKNIRIVSNPVRAALVNPDRDAQLLVNELLSYRIETGMKGMGVAHGSMFNISKNQFPTGFVRLVTKKLEQAGYTVLAQSKTAPEPLGPENPVVDTFPDDPRYDYQTETMRRLVQMKRMIAQIATGGGKSKVFKLCSERLGLPTLFITTRKSLMYQMASGYKTVNSGRPIGILGDGKWEPRPGGVNFAIVDTLTSRLEDLSFEAEMDRVVTKHVEMVEAKIEKTLRKYKLPLNASVLRAAGADVQEKVRKVRKAVMDANQLDDKATRKAVQAKVDKQQEKRRETLEFLEKIGFLTIEEAHEVSSNSFFALCNAMPNAHYRLALTATPNMKDSEEANMRLVAVSGSIGIKVSEKLLIDRGILATPYFKIIESTKPATGVSRGSSYPSAYERGIVKNVARNMQIVEEVIKAKRYGLPAMILVQRTDHGKILLDLLSGLGVSAQFIQGENNQDTRQKALDLLGAGKIDCLIGTTILDVGVDVPAVGVVILAGGGKAEVAIRQRIGRGLRSKKNGPNVCFVVLFQDSWNNHTCAHSRECRRIIEETPGFGERIVPWFEYENYGFSKV